MTSLVQCHIFGLAGHVPDALHHLDEINIIYPAGSNLVIYNLEHKSQKFIPLTEGGVITALTVSSKLIAIAEKYEKKTSITIVDSHTLKKKKVIKEEENLSKGIVSLAFSPDSKYIASQHSEPDWILQLWNWEKGKVVTQTKLNFSANVKVFQISFNPFEKSNLLLSVVGYNLFKIYRYTEGFLKPINMQKLDHRVYHPSFKFISYII
ncbi:Cilia- and flagella-associated protein 57 [Coelomomyces lativittatus]|nr:Cilia- and flagella-associated protein 57 [Coelomomyces lativittatus]